MSKKAEDSAMCWRAKYRLFILVFATWLILDIGARLLAHCWADYQIDDYAVRIAGCAQSPRDLVILGGSPVSEGLDPTIFHGMAYDRQGKCDLAKSCETIESAWSLGLPGGTFTDTYFAFRHGTARHAPPRLIIIGVAATDFNDARNEPHGAYSIYSAADVLDILRIRPEARIWTLRRWIEGRVRHSSSIYRDRHALRLATADVVNQLDPRIAPETAQNARRDLGYAKELQASNGYAPAPWFASANYAQRKARGESFPPFDFLKQYRIGTHASYLERLITEQPRSQVYLVEMPHTADYEAAFPKELALFRDQLAKWEADFGFVVLRLNRAELMLTDNDFADWVHLNRHGAAKFSVWVRRSLERHKEPSDGKAWPRSMP